MRSFPAPHNPSRLPQLMLSKIARLEKFAHIPVGRLERSGEFASPSMTQRRSEAAPPTRTIRWRYFLQS
jgi:hypothetical protein